MLPLVIGPGSSTEFVLVMVSCFLLFVPATPGHTSLTMFSTYSSYPDTLTRLTIVPPSQHPPACRMYLVSPQLPKTRQYLTQTLGVPSAFLISSYLNPRVSFTSIMLRGNHFNFSLFLYFCLMKYLPPSFLAWSQVSSVTLIIKAMSEVSGRSHL